MAAYYNEHDPYAAAWLRNLIAAGHIAPGDVDERSIEDVRPDELVGYRQCHFFAGIGVWSLALRNAGVPDDAEVWTGSCPCQPFSSAGQGAGFDDERHLWPAFFHLIGQRRPAAVFGEQVASKDADPWVDLVCADLESLGYVFGATAFPSAGIGAPHIRDRLYWVANADHQRRDRERLLLRAEATGRVTRDLLEVARRGKAGRLAHADGGHASAERQQRGGQQRQQPHDDGAGRLGDTGGAGLEERQRLGGVPGGASGADQGQAVERAGIHAGGLADATLGGRREERADVGGFAVGDGAQGDTARLGDGGGDRRPGPVNGYWRSADWLGCTDGRWRPVEPGSFPLVDGAAERVGRVRADWQTPAGPQAKGHRGLGLKGYGNAVNAVAAQAFVETWLEVM